MILRRAVNDIDAPELAPYRTMRAQHDHFGRGVFVAEGDNVVRRLVASPHGLRSVLVPPGHADAFEALLVERGRDAELFVAPVAVLEQLIGHHIYQGILALGEVPPPATLAAVRARPGPLLLAAIDGLSGAENVGALVRNAAAFGADALVVGETSSHPYLRRSVRASMGAIFGLPHVVSTDLAATLREIAALGVRVVAAHAHAERATLLDLDLRGDVCLVFGAEGDGLRPAVLAACHDAARIPMRPGIDSLNVAAAAAVFLAEAWRQRRTAS
jgi:tRNA G18 (ribose-2'-O)-methylase SpoU